MSLFLHNERLRNYLLRTILWRGTHALKDRHFGKGTLSKLMRIDLKPTELCNLNCAICGQWGEKGTHRNGHHSASKGVPFEVWSSLVDEVKEQRPFFYIWGGEPLLYDDIIPLIKKVRSIDAPCFMVTNGTRLEEMAEELVEASPDMILISLDGPREVHDTIRGKKGLYDTILRGIEKIDETKKRHNTKYPLIMTTTTLSPMNQNSLLPLFEDLRERDIPIDSALLALPWMLTEEECQSYEEVLAHRFDKHTPSFARGFVNQLEPDTLAQLRVEVQELKKLTLPFSLEVFPDIKTAQWKEFIHQTETVLKKNRCNAIYSTVQIAANGDVSSCRDFPDIVHGNITKEHLGDILNNESFCRFRQEIQNDYLPVCHKCCNLYEHTGVYFPALKL